MKPNVVEIINYFNELFPNPRCELNYKKDYELLIAVVLSAQTTDKRVNSVTEVLFDVYPDLNSLKSAKIDDIEHIIKTIGTYRKKAVFVKEIATIIDEQYGGKVPNSRTILEKIPGVGRKTCNVVLSELFKEPNIAVDTHVNRVSKRLGLAKQTDDVLVVETKLKRKLDRSIWSRTHHQMVLFGRYHCKALSPECPNCKIIQLCKEKNKRI